MPCSLLYVEANDDRRPVSDRPFLPHDAPIAVCAPQAPRCVTLRYDRPQRRRRLARSSALFSSSLFLSSIPIFLFVYLLGGGSVRHQVVRSLLKQAAMMTWQVATAQRRPVPGSHVAALMCTCRQATSGSRRYCTRRGATVTSLLCRATSTASRSRCGVCRLTVRSRRCLGRPSASSASAPRFASTARPLLSCAVAPATVSISVSSWRSTATAPWWAGSAAVRDALRAYTRAHVLSACVPSITPIPAPRRLFSFVVHCDAHKTNRQPTPKVHVKTRQRKKKKKSGPLCLGSLFIFDGHNLKKKGCPFLLL